MPVRLAAAALGTVAAAALLTGCQKPLPVITVLAGSNVHRVDASRFCFDSTSCRPGGAGVSTIRVASGTSLFIDVPRVVATRFWIVTALTTASNGTVTPIQGAGSSVIHDQHTTRIDVPPNNPGESYRVQVDTLDGSRSSGSWTFDVELTS